MSVEVSTPPKVEPVDLQARQEQETQADFMKDIRKKKLQREVYADPTLARELVKVEASPVYNARGELIQAVDNVGG
jgi:HD-like signal output (HDOD) protein